MSSNSKLRLEQSFQKFELRSELQKALDRAGYEKPTPIQAGLIPLAIEDWDVIGQARTGTGKTAAFAIPILEGIDLSKKTRNPQAIILTPTRELALQVSEEMEKLSHFMNCKSIPVYGGKPFRKQVNQLKSNPQIIVGTPGRVIDHLKRGTLDPRGVWCSVLDEADRMLDIGFRADIEFILKQLPVQRQTLLLSATMPEPIIRLAKRYMDAPKIINFSSENLSAETIEQFYISTKEANKFDLLLELLNRETPTQAIIFCRTKLGTMRLHRKLQKLNIPVECIHGDMTQSARDRTMRDFRSEKVTLLVATDVMGRGIDITNLSHIINFDMPTLSDDYVHRVGRTGRMGKEGVAYSFVTPVEGPMLTQIEKRINLELSKDPLSRDYDPKKSSSSSQGSPKKYRRSLSL